MSGNGRKSSHSRPYQLGPSGYVGNQKKTKPSLLRRMKWAAQDREREEEENKRLAEEERREREFQAAGGVARGLGSVMAERAAKKALLDAKLAYRKVHGKFPDMDTHELRDGKIVEKPPPAPAKYVPRFRREQQAQDGMGAEAGARPRDGRSDRSDRGDTWQPRQYDSRPNSRRDSRYGSGGSYGSRSSRGHGSGSGSGPRVLNSRWIE